MANLKTMSEVRALLIKAGADPVKDKTLIRDLAAISMVEGAYSKGGVSYSDFDLVGDQALANATWGYSYSGFQIRSLRAEKGKGTLRDEIYLQEPVNAAKSALQIAKTQGLKAWSTFNTGQYKAFLPQDFPTPPGTYTVVSGDSLSRIAQKLNAEEVKKGSTHTFTWQDLARVNGLKAPYTIFIGYPIFLPWIEYRVQSGDNLISIVEKYGQGVSYDTVASFNGITNANLIHPDQIIRIPRATL